MQEVALDVQEVNVDCPICQGSFPVDQIEMHAAYCDGAPADSPLGGAVPGQEMLWLPVVSSVSLCEFGFQRCASPCVAPVTAKPRRKRTRRCEAGDGASGPAPSTSRLVGATPNPFCGITLLLTWFVLLPREHMKCFICQSAVPVQDYGRHTDLCISRQDGASAAVKLHKPLPSLLVLPCCKSFIRLSPSRRRTCCRRWRKQTADTQVSASCDLRCWSVGHMFLQAHLWL